MASKKERYFDHQGYILIEVLSSLVISGLAIAIFANFFNRSLAMTNDIFQRGQAVHMVSSFAERVAVNKGLVSNYLTVSSLAGDPAAFCADRNDCVSKVCSSSEMSKYDIEQVLCDANGIVNPKFNINCSSSICSDNDVLTISISWDSLGALGGKFSERQRVEFDLIL